MSFMNHSIKIYRPTVTSDDVGGQVRTYALYATVKGRIPGGTASTTNQGSETQINLIVAMLPVGCGVLAKDMLVYKSLWYEINALTQRNNHHIEAEITLQTPPKDYDG